MASTDHAKSPAKAPKAARDHDRTGGPGLRGDASTHAVAESVERAVLAAAPPVVQPIIDQAVTDGKLTTAQAATAKQALADIAAGRRPSADALALLRDPRARTVAQAARAALAQQAPTIVAPVIAAAVTAGTINQAQADRLTARIAAMAADPGARGGIFGAEDHGAGAGPGRSGAPKSGPGRGTFDPAAMTVLQDVAAAILQQAPAVAGPIIDSALSAGTITQAEATELKAAAADAAATGPSALAGHRDLMRSDGVRTVVASVVKALSAQASPIGGPIVDRAVTAGKLTQAQGDAIKQRLTKGFAAGHDRFGGGHRGDGDHSRGHGTTRKQRGG